MSFTLPYREQHQTILDISLEIKNHLNIHDVAYDASLIRILLVDLLNKLLFHLTIEHKFLLPKLLNHNDKKMKELAVKFNKDLSFFGAKINIYSHKWANAKAIQTEPALFIADTKQIFKTISIRIEDENNILYDHLDKVGL